MQVANQSGISPALTTQLQRVVSDGRIDGGELKELRQLAKNLNVPESEKKAFLKLAEKINDYTTVGLFTSDGVLEKSEMAELQKLAGELKDSRLASALFEQFSAFAEPAEDSSMLGSIGNFFGNLFSAIGAAFSGNAAQESDASVGMYEQGNFEPVMESFPDQPTNATPYAPVGDPNAASSAIDAAAPVGVPVQVPGQTGTYTSQWGDVQLAQAGRIPGSAAIHRRESQANCGPSSASMILKQFGIEPPDMHSMRERIGARTSKTGGEDGAFAIGTEQLEQMVQTYAADKGKRIAAQTETLPGNARKALDMIGERLARGEKVVMLTGGFGGTAGHYTVIKSVNPDGSFIVDDPARGPNMRVTADQLQRAMQNRAAQGKGESKIISFKEG